MKVFKYGEPFDYTATPSLFYFDVESVGSLEPDAIVQQGIHVLQQKLAFIIQELAGADGASRGGLNGDLMDVNGYAGPQSPNMNGVGSGGAGGGRDFDMDQGYTTPFVNGGGGAGGVSAWGGGAGGSTAYGATPYGQNGY